MDARLSDKLPHLHLWPALLLRRAVGHFRFPRVTAAADAFLVSYPKSGRTWLRFILSNYFNITGDLRLNVDLHSMFRILPNLALDDARGVHGFRYTGVVPLVQVSHFAYRRRLFRKKPVIFLVRDPRDVLVSSYFHTTRHKQRYAGSMSDFLDGAEGVPALARYLNGWAAGLGKHAHLVVSYEQLMADTVGTTMEVLTFLGYAANDQAVREAVERSRFDVMQASESQTGIPEHQYDRSDREAMRMRRGKVGGFVDYLSQQDIEAIETALSATLSAKAKSLVRSTGLVLR